MALYGVIPTNPTKQILFVWFIYYYFFWLY